MKSDELLVRIDATGTAHPIGRVASRELRRRTGKMELLPAPRSIALLRAVEGSERARPWLVGELLRPGMLWDVMSMVAQGGWSGELVVVDQDGEERAAFVESGQLVGASSTAERERLGRVLLQVGALTELELAAVLRVLTPERRFGELAVALGHITRERLFEVIGRQCEEILFAVMRVSRGSFYFIDGIDEEKLPFRQRISLGALMMEAARRIDETSCFQARIPSLSHVPARTLAPPPEDAELCRCYDAIDGLRSVDELSRALCQGSFETLHALFQLLQRGHATVAAPRPSQPEAVVTAVNEALAAIFERVNQAGVGADVSHELESFATAGGMYDALFRGAGPRADGGFAPGRIRENLALLVAEADATRQLAEWLYAYAAYAMFVAEPLLRARLGEHQSAEIAALSKRVAELLRAVTPP
ncbi:MAG: DUF4388 domain-containing protein [Myxococcales bacterium]|nr:DUF4388 domain-containing protein [Myxococcales bacterium]